MKLRRNRVETFYHRKRIVEKDSEGSTRERYGTASLIYGESWPASGKVQAQQYGQRLNYIRNLRISGKYEIKPDEKGGTDIQESDGICLFVGSDRESDYKIISIKPYRMLTLEVEKL